MVSTADHYPNEHGVSVRPVSNRRELAAFVDLPERVHASHPKWVPPLRSQELHRFDPKHNLSYAYCDVTLALAWREDRVVGRIAGIINRRHNEKHGERIARFGYFECFDADNVTAIALMQYVESWARARLMTTIVGPMGFTDQDPEGLLIDGFEFEPTAATYYNAPWLGSFFDGLGYDKEVDYVVYRVPVKEPPELYGRIFERFSRRSDYKLLEFRRKRELKPYVQPILGLMNHAFEQIYGYTELDPREIESLAAEYLPILDPRFIKAVEFNGEVVAFVIAMPNMNSGIKKARGRLFPFGLIYILRSASKATQLDLMLGGIHEAHRGKGLDVVMGTAMMRTAIAAGMTVMDSNKELETNHLVRGEMEAAGGEVYKRFRIFRKVLVGVVSGEAGVPPALVQRLG